MHSDSDRMIKINQRYAGLLSWDSLGLGELFYEKKCLIFKRN